MQNHSLLIRLLAVGLAVAAVLIGAVAVFTSGYTAGDYVHDLVTLVLALAVLSVGVHLVIARNGGHDDQ
jgi:hypothetical protein